MALVSPPPPPRLGAALPTSPTPAPTPGPAATSPFSPAPRSSPFPPASPVSAISAAGRSKTQRWCHDSPPSGKSGGGASSFMEALLMGARPGASPPAPPEAASKAAASVLLPASAASPVSRAASSRIVLVGGDRRPRRAPPSPDPDGWSKVMCHPRKVPRDEVFRSRRRVPVDLRGRCFNCFSTDHRAASCRSMTRCFRCRDLGHRTSGCTRQDGLRPAAPRRLHKVWRPKVDQAVKEAMKDATAAVSIAPGVARQGSAGRKRRRRWMRKRGARHDKQDDLSGDEAMYGPPSMSSGDDQPPAAGPRPQKILDRSAAISQREDGLTRALVVTVLSGSHESILACVAGRFDVDPASMTVQHFGMARFLLTLPSVDLVVRVFDDGRPFISTSPPLRLHVRRWSRLLDSRAASLSSPIEVDIHGIPAHAWELSTAELLLSDYCWIGAVHPEVAERRDVFKVMAWSSSPALIPPGLDLELVEPPAHVEDHQPAKRTLVYSVTFPVAPAGRAEDTADPPPPPPAAAGGRRRRWRRRSRSPPDASATHDVPRASVHDRLGPRPVRGGHVASRGSGPEARDAPALVTPLPVAPPSPESATSGADTRPHAGAEAIKVGLFPQAATSPPAILGVGGPLEASAAAPEGDDPVCAGNLAPVHLGPSSEFSPAGFSTGPGQSAQCSFQAPQVVDESLQALEALVFVESSVAAAPSGPVVGRLKVYYRRKGRPRPSPPGTASSQPQAAENPPAPTGTSLPTAQESQVDDPAAVSRKTFIDNLTKRTEGLLVLPPPVCKRQSRAPPPTSAPRRSRRGAGLEAEFTGIPNRGARKTVIRSLEIAMEQEHANQKRCPLCDQEDETINHLLAGCVFARQFWHGILSLFGLQEITPLTGELDFFCWWEQASDRLPSALQQGFNTLEEAEFWMLARAKGLSALVAIRLLG
ncbi:hypothetical protein HU200_051063 [Digitaria exilis]|uniref:CCHC-type domain-containing protein n=1 Tax=Digitaria exilis TaxID=1010633 RepID=A0A835AN31_9POAL|nr:hypothetical protein HU200_051063 [Digitaria exilis]CAB3479901.1 unnamed protein product [Digitaria exilis]